MRSLKKTLLFRLLSLLLLALLPAGCAEDPAGEADEAAGGSATFWLQLAPALRLESRADEAEPPIAALWYAVADADGNLLDLPHTKLADDFSKLTIEGLRTGDYAVVLLATTDPQAQATLLSPATLADAWLAAASDEHPLDESWFYRRVDLHIDTRQAPLSQQLELERCVGRFDLDLRLESPYLERFIDRIEVRFDQPEGVCTTLGADGRPGASGALGTVDLTTRRSFCSLPSREPLSGTVFIRARRSNGDPFSRSYTFSDCRIEAGKVTRLAIDFRHPEEAEGTIYVRESDFQRFDCDTMFLANEPREVFYDQKRRSFYPNKPLKLTIDSDHRLSLQFYSPLPIRDVRIRGRFNKQSLDFFDLARFELIYPFMEASFELPVTQGDKFFTTDDGRRTLIRAIPELTNEDLELEVVCDDPFMQKVATITSNWYICYSAFQADQGHEYWRHMDPELCRQGVALTINMAFIFSSPEFNAELDNYEGLLTADNGSPIDLDYLREKIRTHEGLTLGRVVGVGGLGGGRTYGLADYCYHEVYWDWNPDPAADPHTYVRQAMFHEYGHCLGYGHSSTMTYGDQWTVLCSHLYVEMGRAGKLPVCSKSVIADLPM